MGQCRAVLVGTSAAVVQEGCLVVSVRQYAPTMSHSLVIITRSGGFDLNLKIIFLYSWWFGVTLSIYDSDLKVELDVKDGPVQIILQTFLSCK